MSKNRIEAFTDAVIAIVMTLLVLELHQPEGDTFASFLGQSLSSRSCPTAAIRGCHFIDGFQLFPSWKILGSCQS